MANDTTKIIIDGVTYDLKDAGAKRTQSPVSDPSADGTASAFIDSISQDENGVITVTKKNVTSDIPGTAAYANALATPRSIEGVSFNGTANVFRYAVCNSAADADKVVTLSGTYTVADGAVIYIRFANANTKTNATLAINNGTAYVIAHYGVVAQAGPIPIKAGHTYAFIFEGSSNPNHWELIGEFDTNTQYSFADSYNASTNKGATEATVANAIAALDVSDISGFGANKTLSALSETDGKISATFQDIGSLNTSAITAGTLGVARGGTGVGSFTTGRVIVSNPTYNTGALGVSEVTATELGYLSGVTSNVQDQINAISGGGTDHIRFLGTAATTTISGSSTQFSCGNNYASIIGGYVVSVGDLVVDSTGQIFKITAVTINSETTAVSAIGTKVGTLRAAPKASYASGTTTLTISNFQVGATAI